MASRLLTDLSPATQELASKFFDACRASSIDTLVVCTYRSKQEQDQLYAQGRTTPGKIVTHAQGGQSPHNNTLLDGTPSALAFDCVPMVGGKIDWSGTSPIWVKMLDIAHQSGLDCGADWPHPKTDTDHFQLPDWKEFVT